MAATLAVSWAPAEDRVLQQRAQVLAEGLQLPVLQAAAEGRTDRRALTRDVAYAFLLIYEHSGLCLCQTGLSAPGPLRVCFEGGRQLWRLRHGGGRNQLIARALGLHKTTRRLGVLDATAGLGGDAYVLAGLGCHMTLLERSPVVAALLADGLARLAACDDPELQTLATRMQLHSVDAMAYLSASAPVDVVYLDPMFPEHGRASGVRKEMQLFRHLLADAPAAQQQALLDAALQVARHRVVVKRMKKSPTIGGTSPSYQMSGKSVRYDIYALRKYD